VEIACGAIKEISRAEVANQNNVRFMAISDTLRFGWPMRVTKGVER
jgi:hypothetical protein